MGTTTMVAMTTKRAKLLKTMATSMTNMTDTKPMPTAHSIRMRGRASDTR